MIRRPASRLPSLPALATLLLLGAALAAACGGTKSTTDACGVRSCTHDSDCGLGQQCGQGTCFRRATFCAADTISMNQRGEWEDCVRYPCDPISGLCLREAQSTSDCRGGALWDVNSLTCICDPAGQGCGAAIPAFPAYDLACYGTCARDADCAADGSRMCWTPQGGAARCVPRDNYCGNDPTTPTSIKPDLPLDGTTGMLARTQVPCGVNGCNQVTGNCRTDCLDSSDCHQNWLCQLCVDPVNVLCNFPTQVCVHP